MALSKPPKDVLELGRYLVRELGFEDGADTLGRWMAHHLAELIAQAENGATAAERLIARQAATETILRIWEHRVSLPGKAYPLRPYEDVLRALDRLHPGNNPFLLFAGSGETTRDQLSMRLFDNLARLIITLLLMKLPDGGIDANVNPIAMSSLDEIEQHMLTSLQQWVEMLELTSENRRRTRNDKAEQDRQERLDETAIQLIDNAMDTLSKLRNKIETDE